MQPRVSPPVIERAASPLVSVPVAERLEAPLLAIMCHLLEGRDRWRRLPSLRPSHHGARERDQTAMMSPEGAVCAGL
jgi:hypothetical protein